MLQFCSETNFKQKRSMSYNIYIFFWMKRIVYFISMNVMRQKYIFQWREFLQPKFCYLVGLGSYPKAEVFAALLQSLLVHLTPPCEKFGSLFCILEQVIDTGKLGIVELRVEIINDKSPSTIIFCNPISLVKFVAITTDNFFPSSQSSPLVFSHSKQLWSRTCILIPTELLHWNFTPSKFTL